MQQDHSPDSVALIWKWKRRIFCNCVRLLPGRELAWGPAALSSTLSPLATQFLATRIACDRCLGLHTSHICTHTSTFSFNLWGKELWAGCRTAMQLTILSFNSSSFVHVILAQVWKRTDCEWIRFVCLERVLFPARFAVSYRRRWQRWEEK